MLPPSLPFGIRTWDNSAGKPLPFFRLINSSCFRFLLQTQPHLASPWTLITCLVLSLGPYRFPLTWQLTTYLKKITRGPYVFLLWPVTVDCNLPNSKKSHWFLRLGELYLERKDACPFPFIGEDNLAPCQRKELSSEPAGGGNSF